MIPYVGCICNIMDGHTLQRENVMGINVQNPGTFKILMSG